MHGIINIFDTIINNKQYLPKESHKQFIHFAKVMEIAINFLSLSVLNTYLFYFKARLIDARSFPNLLYRYISVTAIIKKELYEDQLV